MNIRSRIVSRLIFELDNSLRNALIMMSSIANSSEVIDVASNKIRSLALIRCIINVTRL